MGIFETLNETACHRFRKPIPGQKSFYHSKVFVKERKNNKNHSETRLLPGQFTEPRFRASRTNILGSVSSKMSKK